MKTKRLIAQAACAALLIAGSAATYAVDTVTQDAMSDRMLKDCMSKKPANMSDDDALANCKKQVDRELKNAKREELSKGPASVQPGPPK